MTISDAIPVQFWVNGVETFNQKEVCGISPVCFCQQFNSDDEIRIQITDDGNEGYDLFKVQIVDESGTEIAMLDMGEPSEDIWEISFTFGEHNITSENVQLKIYGAYSNLINGSFEAGGTPPSGWTELGAAGWDTQTDSFSGDKAAFAIANTGAPTSYLRQIISNLSSGSLLRVYANARGLMTPPEIVTLEIVLFQSDTPTIIGSLSFDVLNEVVNFNYFEELPANYTSVGFRMYGNDTGIVNMYVRHITVETLTLLAYSDCLDVKESHECTALIRYDNAKDFAGIEYSSFSPTAEFYIRIPAVFFHERNTEEEESFEESSENIVRLRNEIKLKRLLEVGFMPDYMHRKLLLILAHDTIEIDGENWIKRDPYEKEEPGNKRYPLKKASVLLTQKDYIKRNIL